MYFGTATPGRPGTVALAQFQIFFNDYRVSKQVKPGERNGFPELQGIILYQDPGGTPVSAKMGLGYTPSAPSGAVPGPWRHLEIDVNPERIRVWWGEPGEKNPPFADLPGDAVREKYRYLESLLTGKVQNVGVELPVWSPRMPIGIWNERAAIDIRNVSITPDP